MGSPATKAATKRCANFGSHTTIPELASVTFTATCFKGQEIVDNRKALSIFQTECIETLFEVTFVLLGEL